MGIDVQYFFIGFYKAITTGAEYIVISASLDFLEKTDTINYMSEIYEYVRSRKGSKVFINNKGQKRRIGGQPIGVVLATVLVEDDTVKIVFGWSKANRKGGDTFDKTKGINIARTRAIHGLPKNIKVPGEVKKVQSWLTVRALNYFKGAVLP